MTKEYLEALNWLIANDMIYRGKTQLPINPALEDIKQYLESIENTNPSEALDCLEEIIHEFSEPHYELSGEYSYKNELLEKCKNEVNTIKQALLKAQEQEKENARAFGKDIINLNKVLKQTIDKPIFYVGRYGNKYIVPQKLFEEQNKVLEIIKEHPFESASTINYIKINKDNPKMLDYKCYCMSLDVDFRVMKEEFELLKRWVENVYKNER